MTLLIGLNVVGWIFFVMSIVMMLILMGAFVFMLRYFIKSTGDEMIVRTGVGGTIASSDGIFVIPFLHQYEKFSVAIRKLAYERTTDSPLRFRCGTKATLTADLMLKVNATHEDAIRALSTLGISRLNDDDALRSHFSSMFNDSLETIALKTTFSDLCEDKDSFREQLLKHIGSDLGGMVIDDLCIYHLTPIASE